MNRARTILSALLVVVTLVGVPLSAAGDPPTPATISIVESRAIAPLTMQAPASVRVTRRSAHALRLTWTPVVHADRYVVQRAMAKPGGALKPYRRVTTVRRMAWLDRRVRSQRVYRYQVQACAGAVCAPWSRWVSGLSSVNRSHIANAGRVRYHQYGPSGFGLLEHYPLEMEAVPSRRASKQGKSVLSERLRYVTSDRSIATVDSRGVVTAWREGRTVVRVIAHNGLEKRVPVVVKNYAYPTTFDPSAAREYTANLKDYWAAEGPRLSRFVTTTLRRRILGPAKISLATGDGHRVVTGAVPNDVAAQAEEILSDYWMPATISIGDRSVDIEVSNGDGQWLFVLSYFYDFDDNIFEVGYQWPAPYWHVVGHYELT
jgi:hypothetical protein